MMSPRQSLRWTAIAVSALALASCAVMRIDVDVYKGPLANSDRVQIEQFAAMAVGARPLLTQLRDTLQWDEERVRSCARTEISWYRAGYFPYQPDQYLGPRKFDHGKGLSGHCSFRIPEETIVPWNERAERVNAVLSLYEDQDLKGLEPYLDRGQQAVDQYRAALSAFDRNKSANKDVWTKIQGQLADQRAAQEASAPKVSKALEKLGLAYKNFLGLDLTEKEQEKVEGIVTEDKSSRAVQRAYQVFLDALDPSDANTFLGGSIDFNQLERGSNHRFAKLRSRNVLDLHARALFGTSEGVEATLFKRKVAEMSDAFLTARGALQDLWWVSLEALTFVAESPSYSEKERDKLLFGYARLISFLTQGRTLVQTLHNPNAPTTVRENLKQRLQERSVVWHSDGESSFNYKVAEKSLSQALQRVPVNVARWLQDADAWLRGAPENEFRRSTYLRPNARRQFGIVRGPTFSPDDLEELLRDWRSVLSNVQALGFERGRLTVGIYSLIEQYLKSLEGPGSRNSDNELLSPEAVRLLDALVRFSTKVLFIADNDKLITDPPKPPKGWRTSAQHKKNGKVDLDRYILVLQAVGNAILVQADELRQRDIQRRNLENRQPAEIWAQSEAFASSAHEVVGNVLANLIGELGTAKTEAAAAKTLNTSANQALAEANKALAKAFKELEEARTTHASAEGKLSSAQQTLASIAAASGIMSESAGIPIPETIKVNAAKPNVTGMEMSVELAVWLKKEVPTYNDDSERKELLQDAIAFYEKSDSTVSGIESMPRADLLARMREILKRNQEQAQSVVTTAAAEFESKKTALAAATSAHDGAKAELASKSEAAKAAAGAEAALKSEITELEHAIAVIRESSSEVVSRVAQSGQAVAPSSTVFQTLVALINDALAKAETALSEANNGNDEAKKAAAKKQVGRLEAADKRLASINQPLDRSILVRLPEDARRGRKDSRDVLDDMIALLRHEHVLAVREAGDESARAKHIGAAIKTAHDHRSGMVYIRPSSAFLRNSYPASSLQSDPGLGWDNMLAGQAQRSIPLVGEDLVNWTDESRLKIQSEIDKQFWQTINSVRVAGGGDSNYAIVKDDIGNWVVKSYSTNQEDIIKAAKSLALFSVGEGLDTDLLSRLDQGEEGGTGQSADGQNEAPSTLERFFQRFEGTLNERTKTDYKSLQAQLEGETIEARIRTSWEGNKDSEPFRSVILEDLSAASADQLKPALATLVENADNKDLHRKTINQTVSTVSRFGLLLRNKINDRDTLLSETKTPLDAAAKTKSEAETSFAEATAALAKAESDVAAAELRIAHAEPGSEEADARATLSAARIAEAAAKEEAAKADQALKTAQKAFDEKTSSHDKRVRALAFVKEEVGRVVREELARLIQSRREALEDFEKSILFLGEVSQPSAPTEAQAEQ